MDLKGFWEKKWYGIKISPFLEMGIFFLGYFLIFSFLYPIDFKGYSLHPFWVIILLMSVQYGVKEGMIAAIVSIGIYWLQGLPPQSLEQDAIAYETQIYQLPALWIATSFVLGQIVERKDRLREKLKEDLENAERREREITRGYEIIKRIKEGLESRLAGQLRTSITTYQALKSLEELRPAKVLLGIETLVRAVLNPEKFSIYALGQNGLEASINVGWTPEDHFQRRYSTSSSLYLEIVGKQKVLSALHEDEAFILGKEGILAAPLFDEESKSVFGMLKIEALDVEQLNLSNIEAFRLICEVAGIAYAHAMSFQRTLHSSVYDPVLPVFSSEYLTLQRDYLSSIAEAMGFPLGEVKIEVKTTEKEHKEISLILAEKLRQIGSTLFGPLAQLFHTHQKGASFTLLLPALAPEQLSMTIEILKRELKRYPPFDERAVEIKTEWLESLKVAEALYS